jgi:hypothetical protein
MKMGHGPLHLIVEDLANLISQRPSAKGINLAEFNAWTSVTLNPSSKRVFSDHYEVLCVYISRP